jgi:hypothetical protein
MIIAFLILGCLVGLRFAPPALAWVIPLCAICATLAAHAGLSQAGLGSVILDIAAVQIGYFIGCGLDAPRARSGRAALASAFSSEPDEIVGR